MRVFIKWAVFLSILVATTASAFSLSLRLNCKPSQAYLNNLYYYLNKITPPKVPQIYYLHNMSNYMLMLDHPVSSTGTASAGWYSNLAPNNWSAIAVSQTGFSLRCQIVMPDGKYYPSSCKLIKVCQPNLIGKEKGNYWVVENLPWKKFMPAVKTKKLPPS